MTNAQYRSILGMLFLIAAIVVGKNEPHPVIDAILFFLFIGMALYNFLIELRARMRR